MDLMSDKSKRYYGRKSGPFLVVLQTFKGLARRLIGFFILTEADRLKAGIYVSNERHEE
jgi:hypothetical protein